MKSDNLEELGRLLAAAQDSLGRLRSQSESETKTPAEEGASTQSTSAYDTAVKYVEARRLRERHFADQNIFGEPAWDILLDLYIRRCCSEVVTLRAASLRTNSPANVAWRWIEILRSQGLVRFVESSDHRERPIVELTASAFQVMTRYLEQIGNGGER